MGALCLTGGGRDYGAWVGSLQRVRDWHRLDDIVEGDCRLALAVRRVFHEGVLPQGGRQPPRRTCVGDRSWGAARSPSFMTVR